MQLVLSQLPESILGIYGPNKNLLGARQRYLHPSAAASIMAMEAAGTRLRFSDMLRSPMESLHAMQVKRGVQPPGFSGHNFGFSIDIDVGDCIKRLSLVNKSGLDVWMNARGWFCHRKDHALDAESWHYNFFGDSQGEYLAACGPTSTSGGLEAKIKKIYGATFQITPDDIEQALDKLGYANLGVFQTALHLPINDTVDERCMRTLAVAASDQQIVPVAA